MPQVISQEQMWSVHPEHRRSLTSTEGGNAVICQEQIHAPSLKQMR